MKVSDYLAQTIGAHCPFVVQGGAAVHMVDSLARSGYRYVCCAHEQAAGFAADGYAKVKGFGVAVSTCGPGATNLLTAAASAYFENAPVLYLVGQQYGFQELDVVGMFKSVTRYAKMVTKVETLADDLAMALSIVNTGPVLVNIHDHVYHGEMDVEPLPYCPSTGYGAPNVPEIFAKIRAPLPDQEWPATGSINPYQFMRELNQRTETIVTDIGNHGVWTKQAATREVISDNQFGAMGYAIAASIGVACAGQPVACVTGDGSIQMNIQEFATLAKHNLNVKIFILNDAGYGMIRCTQDRWLQGRHSGCDLNDLPRVDFERVATAYGIPNRRWDAHEDMDFESIFAMDGPVLVNVTIDPIQGVYGEGRG